MEPKQKKHGGQRDLVIKTSLNADEYLSFKHKCEAAGVAVATRIRVLINRDADAVNRTAVDCRREWPKVGRKRAENGPCSPHLMGASAALRFPTCAFNELKGVRSKQENKSDDG